MRSELRRSLNKKALRSGEKLFDPEHPRVGSPVFWTGIALAVAMLLIAAMVGR